MPFAMPSTGLPNTSTLPSLAGSSPEIRASVVDLPQPVGPTTAQNSPDSTARLRSCSAVYTPPDGVRNRFVTPRSSIAKAVASTSAVQQALLAGDPTGLIQKTAEDTRRSTGARYVVVTDRRGIRYSHPNPALIGKPVDENPGSVLAGSTWVGVQRGTLGVSARGKAPIFYEGQVIAMFSVVFLEAAPSHHP